MWKENFRKINVQIRTKENSCGKVQRLESHVRWSSVTIFNIAIGFEMSTRNIKIIMFLGSKVRLVSRANNLTAIYEPFV
jgi:hypothetical protein